jgi:hypothetical protein
MSLSFEFVTTISECDRVAISRLRGKARFGGQGPPQIWRAGVFFAWYSILVGGHTSNLYRLEVIRALREKELRRF